MIEVGTLVEVIKEDSPWCGCRLYVVDQAMHFFPGDTVGLQMYALGKKNAGFSKQISWFPEEMLKVVNK